MPGRLSIATYGRWHAQGGLGKILLSCCGYWVIQGWLAPVPNIRIRRSEDFPCCWPFLWVSIRPVMAWNDDDRASAK